MSLEDVSGQQQLRALSHPVRLQILSLLTGTAMSSAELARELGLNHAAVSFHVRQLVRAGYLELAETRSVRGGKERRYRQRPGSREQWEKEDPRLTVQAAVTELNRRLSLGPSEWRVFGDAELWVDPQTWNDVATRIGTALNELHEKAVTPHAPDSVHVNATAMLFAIEDAVEATADPDLP